MFQKLRSRAGAMSASGALVLGVLAGPAAVVAVVGVVHPSLASESTSTIGSGSVAAPAVTVGEEQRSPSRTGVPAEKSPIDDGR